MRFEKINPGLPNTLIKGQEENTDYAGSSITPFTIDNHFPVGPEWSK